MDNTTRLAEMLAEIGADWAILTSPDSVCFATGHVVPIEIGPSPFSGGPTTAFVSRDGVAGVVCPNTDAGQAIECEEISYTGFACSVVDQVSNYLAAVKAMLEKLGVSGRVAVEPASLTAALAELLPENRSVIDDSLKRLKAIKTTREIGLLTRSAEVAAIGQKEAVAISISGRTELDVLNGIRARMETEAGTRCALAGEFLAGIERSSTLGLMPGAYELQKGDPVVCDLAPRVQGYWGDSCSSFVVEAEKSDEFAKMHEACFETLQFAISELMPGLKVCDFDRLLRNHLSEYGYSYPHHSGHGIGTSVHEWPRLIPDETAMIEENMVLMVEPGSYVPGLGGVRCEFMLRVTNSGAVPMATF
ncbi:Xaa-Pro peptidase family protein [Halocynthiibacter sp. C4]|uniref:M24 family metallopeptidase n=1 Tax=Halocynthiibacter sp. C4 TaxID=2992758 RepID=UPI00237B7B29|nr:Xaa-Pro peptidase family protein [Halocynthiibacter sp. C4]MDE0591437.1 Xaa-Pro peptidase family protein [Halocynthiibacter sp. C4]